MSATLVQTEEERLAWYRTMRDTDPVSRDSATGAWNVFRYEDVASILADHQTFSSSLSGVMPEASNLIEGNVLRMDLPRHHRLRSLVSKAFTPTAIAQMEPRIAELTHDLLDETGGRSTIELVTDLSYPLPVIVIAEMLGVPAEDRPRFREWADALLTRDSADPLSKAQLKSVKARLSNFYDYLQEHVAQRRARPRRDLLTDLVEAEIDGERLRDREVVGFATVLLLAGHITTTALLCNAIRCLDEHPEAQAALRADPAAIALAVEEVLRYRSPFALLVRATTAETIVGGKVIPPEQLVMAWVLSANHDERQFEHPDEFVIGRQPNAHLGFGRGIHFCLGAPLARLESRVALGILLRRYSRLRVDPNYPLEGYVNPGFNSTKTLHLLVEPA
ncbi:MAG TPA: cytochrome P450 [Candidatus Dormibacteraeota bacterium]|nr:cytochrome P450 [Candidatus Dormibacteraeota bacterium]